MGRYALIRGAEAAARLGVLGDVWGVERCTEVVDGGVGFGGFGTYVVVEVSSCGLCVLALDVELDLGFALFKVELEVGLLEVVVSVVDCALDFGYDEVWGGGVGECAVINV
eukprot:9826060-Alexandrium_andersonii.AAC.1